MTSLDPRTIKALQGKLDDLEEGELGKYEPTKKVRGQDYAKKLSMDELVPRENLAKGFEGPVKKLGDGSWKVRKEGLEEIEELLKGAGGRMKPNVPSSVWQALRGMQKDSNKNLIQHSNPCYRSYGTCWRTWNEKNFA
eukprot:UN32901